MNNETGVKKGLTTQKCSKTKMVTHTTGTFGWSVPFLRHFRRYITCPARQLQNFYKMRLNKIIWRHLPG